MLDVKYSGEDLQKEKPNYLGVGCGLIGSAHVRMTNYFLELWGLWACVLNSPHLQIVAFLCREALQGHVGVELEHILVQLVVLQLDSKHTRKHINTCSGRKCSTGAFANVIFVTVRVLARAQTEGCISSGLTEEVLNLLCSLFLSGVSRKKQDPEFVCERDKARWLWLHMKLLNCECN